MSLVSDPETMSGSHAREIPATSLANETEYDFLLNDLVNREHFGQACTRAARWGVHPHEVLLATGAISEADYMAALAKAAGVSFNARLKPGDVTAPRKASLGHCLRTGFMKNASEPGGFVLAQTCLRPLAFRALLSKLGPYPLALACPRALRGAVYQHFAPALSQKAIETLSARRPQHSARFGMAGWQPWALCLGGLLVLCALIATPLLTLRALSLLLAALFIPVIALRAMAVLALAGKGGAGLRQEFRPSSVKEQDLPTYTILAPLYREAHMLPQLLKALGRLDWPAPKLDIKLVLEEADETTLSAARALRLPSNVEIVVVPDVEPRTKPKALNYALPLARGKYLVVFDAEDLPEPGQLRQAHAAFQSGPPTLATVQARLNVYNPNASWLTRQFTMEYTALFDGLLPFLDRHNLPIPLGGTSNHFRVAALKWLHAWDPFNVTEDADLGTRLARSGYRCAVIGSTTFEEAPAGLSGWFPQRTRWLKGFIQTWLVHMRAPRSLWRELGPTGFLSFQVMIFGTVLSALVHPWFYLLLAAEFFGGGILALPVHVSSVPLWLMAVFSLVAGYGTAMALAALAVRRRGLTSLLWHVPLMPIYWLLISAAAYRALWQFVWAPFKWEKTEHGRMARRGKDTARPGPKTKRRI